MTAPITDRELDHWLTVAPAPDQTVRIPVEQLARIKARLTADRAELAAVNEVCDDRTRERDSARAELTETRAIGDALATGVTKWLTQGPDGPLGKTMLCPLVDMWNEASQ